MKDLGAGAGNAGAQRPATAAVGHGMYRRLQLSVKRLQSGNDAGRDLGDPAAWSWARRAPAAGGRPGVRLDLLRSFTEITTHGRPPLSARPAGRSVPPLGADACGSLVRASRLFDVRRVALRDDVYLIEYGDRVAAEGLLGRLGLVRRVGAASSTWSCRPGSPSPGRGSSGSGCVRGPRRGLTGRSPREVRLSSVASGDACGQTPLPIGARTSPLERKELEALLQSVRDGQVPVTEALRSLTHWPSREPATRGSIPAGDPLRPARSSSGLARRRTSCRRSGAPCSSTTRASW